MIRRNRLLAARTPIATTAMLAFALTLLVASRLSAADSACRCSLPRPQDEVWLVSQRGAGCDVARGVSKLQYWHYDRQKSWVRASLAELQSSDDPHVITTVFVHGNRIDWCEAFTKGWNAYRTLVCPADERPVRFIIWSWPSEAVKGPVRDAREKAARTDPAGYYLGWFLDQLNPDVPVSLWAHSFGARIATGGLHVLGGGSLGGHRLAKRAHATRQPVQVVLLVAALDNDWLLPGHYHGQAMSQVSSMLLVNNCCDMLLQRYHLIYGRRCDQQALGYTGLGGWAATAADKAKVDQVEACSLVGRRHQFVGYITSNSLVARMRPYLLFDAPEKTARADDDRIANRSAVEADAEKADDGEVVERENADEEISAVAAQ
jgi:hypothetical protein